MKKAKKKIKAAILIIGNEVLSGRTQDLNVSFISDWLNTKCGISVEEVRIIPDIEKTIIFNVLDLSKKFKYVFTTGGIGPTHDDITSLSISKAFKVKYEFNKEAYSILEKYYGKKNDYRASEGKVVEIPYKGALKETLEDYLGGVRSTCTYIGAKCLKHMPKCTTFVVVTQQLNNVFK